MAQTYAPVAAPDGFEEAASGLGPRFEIIRPLGQGSQKSVVLAHDHHNGRDVAVARIEKRKMSESDLSTFRELYPGGRLDDCPHIVPCEEVIEGDSAYYTISPYLAGGSLQEVLDALPGRQMPLWQVLELGSRICRALAHTHRRGIVHGDVKPANILLDDEGRAFLSDFGYARMESSKPEEIRGTPAYLAPEILRGEAPSEQGDLYSLGCMLHEALTGEPPFRGESLPDTLRLQQVGQAIDLATQRKDVPLQLSELIRMLLAKNSSRRPESAWDVMAALWGMSKEHGTYALSAPDFDDAPDLIGRAGEFSRLMEVIDRGSQGRPQLALVSGIAGIGKTRLLRSTIEAERERGGLVFYGNVIGEQSIPYGRLVFSLIQLAGHLSTYTGKDREALRRFLYLTVEEEVFLQESDLEGRREDFYSSIVAGLEKLSARHPTTLVLDDLHLADAATLDLLCHLERAFAGSDSSRPFRLSIVGSFRPAEASDELSRLAGRIAGSDHGMLLSLNAFSELDARDYLCALGLHQPSRELIESAHRYAHGIPFFLKSLARELREKKALEEQDGFTMTRVAITELGLPDSLREWLATQLDALSPEVADFLSGIALTGPLVDRNLLDSTVSVLGIEPDDLVRQALEAGLLRSVEGEIRFSHPLVREALAGRIEPQKRQRMHLQLADYWEAQTSRDPRLRDPEIARHLIAAGELAAPSRIALHATRAARHAMVRFAWAEASEFLSHALEHSTAPLDRAQIHRDAGRVQLYRLDAETCLRHYREASRILRSEGSPSELAACLAEYIHAALWLGRGYAERVSSQADELRRALSTLDSDDASLRALVLSILAQYEIRIGRPGRARQLARAAMAWIEAGGDASLQAQICVNLGYAEFHFLRVREALAIFHRGREQSQRAGDRLSLAQCDRRLHSAAFSLGDFDELERAEQIAVELGSRSRAPGQLAVLLGLLTAHALVRGDLDAAERYAREAIGLSQKAGFPWVLMTASPALAGARVFRGDLRGAREALRTMIGPANEPAGVFDLGATSRRCSRLCDYYVGERVDFAPADREELLRDLEAPEPTGWTLSTACHATEMAAATQDQTLAAAALPCLEKADSQGWIFTTGWPFFVPRVLGVAATIVGDLDLATGSFEQALAWSKRLHLPIERGRVLLDHAQLLALRNAGGDRQRALELAEDARRSLSTIPQSVFAQSAEKLARYLRTSS
jgi:tetratricopeptide (TPR) repeat protein